MHQATNRPPQCDDEDETPSPDPLTAIFEWIESDEDDVHEDGLPAQTTLRPVPLEKAKTTAH